MRHYPLVEPKYDREPDSIPGPFYVVADTCIICALPPEVAPENITWDESFLRGGCEGCPNHCRVSKQPETDAELQLMIEAANGSCVEAIRYCGTDAHTLKQLGAGICDALPALSSEVRMQGTLNRQKSLGGAFGNGYESYSS